MLSKEQMEKIREIGSRYARKEAALPEALGEVQEERGWVDDEELKSVAEYLAMHPSEAESVATFYSLIFRRPVGRHVILLCDSVSCWIMGYRGLAEYFAGSLGIRPGETTADGRFTLLPVACLGACDGGPAMMVDGILYTNLTGEKIEETLKEYT